MSYSLPPIVINAKGEPRKVGFELEFAGIEIEKAAQIIQDLYGGSLQKEHRYHYKIVDTKLGDFRVELDAKILRKMAKQNVFGKLGFDFNEESFKKSIGDVVDKLAMAVVPLEVVMPPVPIQQLNELEILRKSLQKNKAEGTHTSLVHAFGMHMNIESPDLKISTLLKYLRSFIIIYPWLLETLDIDISRRISPFIDPFPKKYTHKILESDYNPGKRKFIIDYIKDNPTRNRPVDMMPIFGLLDEDLIKPVLKGEKNSPRPAFHYRLPNSRINDPAWHFKEEWKAWLAVEQLTMDEEMLRRLSRLYLFREDVTVISFRKEWARTVAILLDLDE
ncbi:MAG TPA: amidoligase family protein [Balneolaceae bacterium]|nr:amidoligase family protein [Balneolaceae bacterium]